MGKPRTKGNKPKSALETAKAAMVIEEPKTEQVEEPKTEQVEEPKTEQVEEPKTEQAEKPKRYRIKVIGVSVGRKRVARSGEILAFGEFKARSVKDLLKGGYIEEVR